MYYSQCSNRIQDQNQLMIEAPFHRFSLLDRLLPHDSSTARTEWLPTICWVSLTVRSVFIVFFYIQPVYLSTALLKHTELICQSVVDCGVLQLLVHACRSNDVPTLRHAALSLAHISVFGGVNSQGEMMRQHAIEWLFRLAFYPDEVVQYFACLATVVLSTNP